MSKLRTLLYALSLLLAIQQKGARARRPSLCDGGEKLAPRVPVPKTIVANGCGPQGMQIPESFGLHVCCNRHDLCYQSCGTTFKYCEKVFQKCVERVCAQYKGDLDTKDACSEQAETFTGLTAMFGGAFHSSSQEGVCDCVAEEEAPARFEEFLHYVRSRSLPTESKEKRDAFVRETMKKYEGKEGRMVYRALKQYRDEFVHFDNIKAEL